MNRTSEHSGCHYCGLPVPKPLFGRRDPGQTGPVYCCVGCRIAEAIVQETGDAGVHRATLIRLGLAVFFTMNVMVFTFALWAYDLDGVQQGSAVEGTFADLLRSLCLMASLPVLVLLGGPVAQNAWDQLKRSTPSTDLLILTAVLAAYLYSAWSVWQDSGAIYVETACVILVFVTLGRWLEATGKRRSLDALERLQALLPDEVICLSSGEPRTVPLHQVVPGDRLRVAAGTRVPADGILESSAATIDEQLVTGESWPVDRKQGEPLVGGTLNLVGDVVLRVTLAPSEGTLARLVKAVRDARLGKGPYQRMAERVSHWFFPVISIISLLTFAVHTWLSGFGDGLLTAMSVLLIACPCALGIATPMAIWVAMGVAARRGIVLRSAEVLEQLATLNALFFDKTGTLTTGEPKVQRLISAAGESELELQLWAAVLAERSTHVFSKAIRDFCGVDTRSLQHRVASVSSVPGRGLYACVDEGMCPVALGNRLLAEELELETPPELETQIQRCVDEGISYSLLGWGGMVRGLFLFEESLRPDIHTALQNCTSSGFHVGVLTGDHQGRGRKLSEELGISVLAELSPEGKVQAISQARKEFGPVAMVGDGINDAAACTEADVGIAMGCGADVARDSAAVCLVSNEISQIPWLLNFSQRTIQTVRSNLWWAFGYNAAGVTVAACGWLHPSLAAVLMVGSSVYVIFNSLKLSDAEHGTHHPPGSEPAASPAGKMPSLKLDSQASRNRTREGEWSVSQ